VTRDLFFDDPPPAQDEPGGADWEALFEYSARAYDAACQAGMSELPAEKEINLYVRKVLAAAREAEGRAGGQYPAEAQLAAREAADRAASDRGDPAVRAVLAAAFKVNREIERMMGMLRFSPREDGLYLARCAPDHFVLPCLAEHFYRRFGETPWAIVDEKRGLTLIRRAAEIPRLECNPVLPDCAGSPPAAELPGPIESRDPWEELWRTYHRSVNIENRKNAELQKRFMPARYWKYLTELKR
jgi:probable DNA metabolism protein